MPDSSSLNNLHVVADTLAAGFQALLEQVEEQKQIEDKLRCRLEQAVQKVCLISMSPLTRYAPE